MQTNTSYGMLNAVRDPTAGRETHVAVAHTDMYDEKEVMMAGIQLATILSFGIVMPRDLRIHKSSDLDRFADSGSLLVKVLSVRDGTYVRKVWYLIVLFSI